MHNSLCAFELPLCTRGYRHRCTDDGKKISLSVILSIYFNQKRIWLEEYSMYHKPHMHTQALLTYILKHSNIDAPPIILNITGSTSSEGHFRLEVCQNVWDTVLGVQSILHVCWWSCLPAHSPEKHVHAHSCHTHSIFTNCILAITSVKLQGEKSRKEYSVSGLLFFHWLL